MTQKTPMQELLEWVRATLPMDLDTPRMIEEKIESMLEKEKERMCGLLNIQESVGSYQTKEG